MSIPETNFKIPSPPSEVFGENPIDVANETGKAIYVIDHIEYPETGGIFVYYKGLKYPRKGFPFPEAIYVTNIVKRMVVNLSHYPLWLPVCLCRRSFKRFLDRFTNLTDMVVGSYYFTPRYQMAPAKELNRWITLFFKSLGITTTIGNVFGIIIEQDTAYCFRFQDIMGEVNQQELYEHPRKELLRLFSLLQSRELDPLIRQKFSRMKWLWFLLLIPSIKRAFVKATRQIDFIKLAFTEADRYQVMPLSGYDYFGQCLNERLIHFKLLYGDPPQPFLIT